MIQVNIYDAKANLSKYLAEVEAGETIVVCRRNVPIAEIRPIERPRTEPRPIGLDKGRFEVPPDFFQALPDEFTRGFEGAE